MKKTFGTLALCLLVGLAALSLGGCGGGSDTAENGPVPNPYLASSLYAVTHFDSSQSDSTPYGPPPGTFTVSPDRQPIVYGGPVNIMTLASTQADYLWGVGTDRVAYVKGRDGAWTSVASLEAPAYTDPTLTYVPESAQRAVGEQSFEGKTSGDVDRILTQAYGQNYTARLQNSSYSVVDRDNVLYANYGRGIYAFALTDPADPAKGIRVARSADIAAIQGAGATTANLFGLSMTYDGHLVVNFSNGVAVVDRSLDAATAQFVPFGADERTSNSLAVDEKGGIYVASNKLMHKLVWTGTTLSAREADGAWTSPYDAPDDAVPPIVKFGTGTGSTPTLMGFGSDRDKLVVITDGAKRMKLVAFWREDIPGDFVQRPGTASRRIAGQIPVTCGFGTLPEWIQSEQSVVVRGYGAFVVNNIPQDAASFGLDPNNKLLGVFTMGPVFPSCLGVERFRWDPATRAWASAWARPDVSSPSMIPVHSRSSRMALVTGYYGAGGWEVTGLDWDTGTTVHRTILGKQNYGNGAYAILEYLPNGDLLFNSAVGPYRVTYPR
ncbi:hypothetical protein [Aminomonas paucivorans]|uniref:hypothetical protein n=1 Tax=Aminomonas paucivorans TaxID=81412 RepID=UPI003323F25B